MSPPAGVVWAKSRPRLQLREDEADAGQHDQGRAGPGLRTGPRARRWPAGGAGRGAAWPAARAARRSPRGRRRSGPRRRGRGRPWRRPSAARPERTSRWSIVETRPRATASEPDRPDEGGAALPVGRFGGVDRRVALDVGPDEGHDPLAHRALRGDRARAPVGRGQRLHQAAASCWPPASGSAPPSTTTGRPRPGRAAPRRRPRRRRPAPPARCRRARTADRRRGCGGGR